ncbi:hypothetical protein [Marivita sp. S2033]|uniref:hypothetical protein n=1 Tax=Marivita sp. S2033 TaxID=3373187 RepID=UPI003981E0BE
MDRLIITLATGYGIGAILGVVSAINGTLFSGFLVFWIGGACATLVSAGLLKLLVWNERSTTYRKGLEVQRIRVGGFRSNDETGYASTSVASTEASGHWSERN